MTTPPPPPGYPPQGPPPGPPQGPPPGYGPPPAFGPPPRTSPATLVVSLLAALFVLATAGIAVALNQDSTTATAVAAPGAGGTSTGVPAGSSPSSFGTSPSPVYTPPTTSYVPSPTPTRRPLDGETINRTFQVYMNALLNRSLSQLRSATCPRLRGTLSGTALDGRYINRWQGRSYRIYDVLDYVIIPAKVRYVNPNTGGNGGSHTYRWYVTRYPDGRYWVCGILK